MLLGVWIALLTCLGVVLFKSQPPVRKDPHVRVPERRACVNPSKLVSEGMMGVVMPQQAVEMTAQTEGRLERLLVKEGDHVPAGAVLGSLALKELQNQEAVAIAALAAARAEEQRAGVVAEEKQDWLRRSEQPAAGVLPEREIEEARYAHKMALADLEAARARTQQRQAELTQLRTRLSEGQLRMPFDGVVTARYLSVGAMVRSGTSILRVIQDSGPLVRFAIPEAHSREVSVGAPVLITLPEGGEPLRARVDNISPEVDAASRMIFATATLEPTPQGVPLAVGKVIRVKPEGKQGSAEIENSGCL